MMRNAKMMAFSQWCIQNPSICPLKDSLEACSSWSCVQVLVFYAGLTLRHIPADGLHAGKYAQYVEVAHPRRLRWKIV